MRLLIITQAVDTDDAALGFFVSWISSFAPNFEQVSVICLKEGVHQLPSNVRVYSLGKEKGTVSRLRYSLRFFRLAWSLRHTYDTVFVHMNEEYLLIAGWLWKVLGTRTALWRNHKMGSYKTRIAMAFSNVICYTSPQAFVAKSAKSIQMPIGIDTEFFKPAPVAAQGDTILFLGRLDPVKKVEVFVDALVDVSAPLRASLYGAPSYPGSTYAADIANKAKPLVQSGRLSLNGAVSQTEAKDLYRQNAIYVNLTPSGSFDKTIGEAMASGCIVICANDAVQNVLPPEMFIVEVSSQPVTKALEYALSLAPDKREAEVQKLRAYIETTHSLKLLTDQLVKVIK